LHLGMSHRTNAPGTQGEHSQGAHTTSVNGPTVHTSPFIMSKNAFVYDKNDPPPS
jgi:hypothetical protein